MAMSAERIQELAAEGRLKLGHREGAALGRNGSAPESGKAHPRTDIANGKRFVKQHGTEVRYNADWRRWLAWDGARWCENAVGVEAMAKQTAVAIWDEAKDANSRELSSWAIRSQSTAGVHGALEMAHSETQVVVKTKDLDADPWLLNTLSGTVDLRTGAVSDAKREDLITKMTAAPADLRAECPRWERFLGEVFTKPDFTPDHDLIAYIQRLAGYSLTGSTREQMFAILHGTGNNGKGVFVNTLGKMLGDYAGVTPAELLMAKRNASHPTEFANLFGRRLVVSAETDAGRKLNEATVKNITGSDSIAARRMHEDWWSFTPTHKIMLATNYLPEVRGTDEGIWRRIHMIAFLRRFEGLQQDDGLEEKLRAEWPGILAWCVRGCLDWQTTGLLPPPAVLKATEEYRQTSDSVARFIQDRCETANRAAFAAAGALFSTYQEWCHAEGEEPMTGTAFGRDMTSRGFPVEVVRVDSATTRRNRKHIGLKEVPGL